MSRKAGLNNSEKAQALDLVLANRILAQHGIVDGFGHVSVRSQNRPDCFLLARNMAPSLVEVPDIHRFDLGGTCLTATDIKIYLERFIHAEIYRARPDVVALVHAHTESVIPFGIVPSVKLRPVYHMGAFIGSGLPIFEIRDRAAGSDLLIRDARLGAALATELGTAPAILMRGHGVTIVGADLRQAVFRAVYLDANARIQATAERLGPPIFLNEGEAKSAESANDSQIDRCWHLWRRDL